MTHLVIGGGIMGLLTAYYLNEANEKVIILEQGKLGRESSWAGGGILSPLYPWRYPKALNDLAAWSQQTYPALVEQLKEQSGIDAELYRCGFLILDQDEIEEAVRWSQQLNIPLEIISPPEIQQHVPSLSKQQTPKQAIWMPEIAQVRNPRLLKALIATLKKRGVEIREHTPVTDFLVTDQQIAGVVSGKHQISGDTVTVACGAWSHQVLQSYLPNLNVEPVRGQMILFKAIPDLLPTMLMRESRYLIPRLDGRIIVGSTLEHVGFDKSTTDTAKQQLTQSAIDLIPELKNFPIEHHWSGLRPGNSLQTPFISQHPSIRGLFINTGHFRNGVVTGPASARLCVDQILNITPTLDPHPFNL